MLLFSFKSYLQGIDSNTDMVLLGLKMDCNSVIFYSAY